MNILVSGMATGLALIVAIGAQNAYVLRQGIRRSHVGVVVALCALSDLTLIALGTLGIGTLVEHAPWLLEALRWGGVVYLVWFAIGAFRSAFTSAGTLEESQDPTRKAGTRRTVILTTLSLTFLNPHVYLDTVVMLGNLANQHGDQRWIFAGGAMLASVIWFCALGFGARALAKPLNNPTTWRVVDILVGVVMLLIALKLALGS